MNRFQRVHQYFFVGMLAFMFKLGAAVLFLAGMAWSTYSWTTNDRVAQSRMVDRLQRFAQVFTTWEDTSPTATPAAAAVKTSPARPSTAAAKPAPLPPRVELRGNPTPTPTPAATSNPSGQQTVPRGFVGTIFLDRNTVSFTVIFLSALGALLLFGMGELLTVLRNQAINSDLTNNLLRQVLEQQETSHRPHPFVGYPRRAVPD